MTAENPSTDGNTPKSRRPKIVLLLVILVGVAAATAVLAGLLVNIFQRKQEA